MNDYLFRFGQLENLDHPLARISDLETRFQHTYIIGSTGTGKTSIMLRMALYDIKKGLACIFIDPKGDHARQLYSLVPDKSRIIYFSYHHPSLVVNPLRKKGYRLNDLIDEFIEILDILISRTSKSNPSASENMKEVLGESIRALKEEDRNINFLYEFLRYPDVRKAYLNENPSRYWQELDRRDKGGSSEEALTAKRLSIRLSKFVQDEALKKVINGENQLDIAEIARNGQVLIVDTSGMSLEKRIYVTSLFSFAVKSYVEFQKQETYYPLMFYLDECWMGVNSSFEYLLKFGRSFKVGFTLAHQEISSFPAVKTLKSIVSNCITKIAMFPAGPEESSMLADVYGLSKKDFLQLDRHQAWVRILNKNSLVKTFPPPVPLKLEDPPNFDKVDTSGTAGNRQSATGEELPRDNRDFFKDCWFSC
jgi:hypothetical protein